jgi:hypothetical protein
MDGCAVASVGRTASAHSAENKAGRVGGEDTVR